MTTRSIRTGAGGLAAALVGTLAASAQEAYPEALTVGRVAPGTQACVPAAAAPAPWAGYLGRLETRLQLTAELCTYPDEPALVAAMATGAVDFAEVSREAAPAANADIRPILHIREDGEPPRSEIVVVAPTAAGLSGAEAAAGARLVAARDDAVAFTRPRASLAVHAGVEEDDVAVTPAGSIPAAFAALTAGEADAAILPITYYGSACSQEPDACAALSVAWRAFPVIDRAWALRAGAALELRYRLIGVHVPFHLEDPTLFRAVAGPTAVEFAPTEPTAFTLYDAAG